MKETIRSVPLNDEDRVSAVLSAPDTEPGGSATGVVVAHGAANDMHHPLIRAFARDLADAGFFCLRFNFLYREKNRQSIDPPHRLILAFQQAMALLRAETGCDRIIAAGKSLGARTAALATASADIHPQGLIFLGYPLHAPGKKDALRDAPLYDIPLPMLFFEGTRDPFCDLERFETVFQAIKAPKDLMIIDGGDHGFSLPQTDPRSEAAIYSQISETAVKWIRDTAEPE